MITNVRGWLLANFWDKKNIQDFYSNLECFNQVWKISNITSDEKKIEIQPSLYFQVYIRSSPKKCLTILICSSYETITLGTQNDNCGEVF